jgi:hypothetical protein
MIESYIFSGRTKKPLWKKLTGIVWWWWMNDSEQTVDQAPDYHPEWPYWRRWLIWNVFRNPLQNFRAFVIGVQDRNYTVDGKAPVLTVQRSDLVPPQTGWQWCILQTAIPRGFISYSGTRVVWYAGWQPSGFFGFKLNFKL